jgi:hypothetical protein
MDGNLATTNVLLLIMAISLGIETLLLIGACIAGWVAYSRVMRLVDTVEERHIVPLAERVDLILDDLRGVTATVKDETVRVDRAIHATAARVESTADRVRRRVRAKASPVVGALLGFRRALEELMRPKRVGLNSTLRREAGNG